MNRGHSQSIAIYGQPFAMLMELCKSWHLASAITAASVSNHIHTDTGRKRLERQEVRVTMCVNMRDKEGDGTEGERDTHSER